MMRRRGFTLTELLITVAIIGIMATMVLFAMFSAQETAKVHKTRALITKLNDIVMRRYDEYRTRRVPFVFPDMQPGLPANQRAQVATELARARLDCLRDLMRMELPDRWSDVLDDPVAPFAHGFSTSVMGAYNGTVRRPAVSQTYFDRFRATTGRTAFPLTDEIIENQGAECLYMIVMSALAEEGDGREFFKAGDVADVDGDGLPEFVDAWGSPIEFIRWAPGYLSDLNTPFRLEGTATTVDPHTVTVQVTGSNSPKRLSQAPGSYVGGAIAFLHQDSKAIDPSLMGRITGYSYTLNPLPNPPTVIFTCTTPPGAPSPFGGNAPSGEFVLMQPDPFDSRGAYPRYDLPSPPPPSLPHSETPTYAIYPLIISRGPDRATGVKDGAGGGTTLHYVNERLNPFFVAPIVHDHPMMLGSVYVADDGEPNWKLGCDKDNITSHNLTGR